MEEFNYPYRVVKTIGESWPVRYTAERRVGSFYSPISYAATLWGAKRIIKKARRKREQVVYETD